MWIDSIFLWLYCMRFSEMALLLFVLTLFYLVLKHYFHTEHFWHIAVAVMLLFWFLAVMWNTLLGRDQVTDFSASSVIPFHSYYKIIAAGEWELLRSNFMNVILFYPAGLLACDLLPKHLSRAKRIISVTILFALMSFVIEFCQYRFALGQAEADDVIHNTLGALIGALVSTISFPARDHAKGCHHLRR